MEIMKLVLRVFVVLAVLAGSLHLTRTGRAIAEMPSAGVPERAIPLRDTLQLLRLYGDSETFGQVYAIFDTPRHILVSDRLSSWHIAALSRETGRVTSWAGTQGQGPGEFSDPGGFLPAEERSDAAWMYDFKNRRISLVRADSAGVLAVLEERRFILSQADIDVLAPLGDGYVGTVLANDATLHFFDSKGQSVSSVLLDGPHDEKAMPQPTGRWMVNRASMAVRPAGDRIVVGYYSGIDFVVLNRSGEPLHRFRGPKEIDARFYLENNRFFWDDGNEYAYTRILATDTHILAWFCGCKRFRKPDPSTGEPPPPIRRPRLHAFTWNGQLAGEYSLTHPVVQSTSLALSHDGKSLLGQVEDPYPKVAEWALPPELWPEDAR